MPRKRSFKKIPSDESKGIESIILAALTYLVALGILVISMLYLISIYDCHAPAPIEVPQEKTPDDRPW